MTKNCTYCHYFDYNTKSCMNTKTFSNSSNNVINQIYHMTDMGEIYDVAKESFDVDKLTNVIRKFIKNNMRISEANLNRLMSVLDENVTYFVSEQLESVCCDIARYIENNVEEGQQIKIKEPNEFCCSEWM